MEYAVSPNGLVVHSRKDWPCAMCRPRTILESRGYCLCVNCAHGVVAAAGAGLEGARALLNDVTDALALLEGPAPEARFALN